MLTDDIDRRQADVEKAMRSVEAHFRSGRATEFPDEGNEKIPRNTRGISTIARHRQGTNFTSCTRSRRTLPGIRRHRMIDPFPTWDDAGSRKSQEKLNFLKSLPHLAFAFRTAPAPASHSGQSSQEMGPRRSVSGRVLKTGRSQRESFCEGYNYGVANHRRKGPDSNHRQAEAAPEGRDRQGRN